MRQSHQGVGVEPEGNELMLSGLVTHHWCAHVSPNCITDKDDNTFQIILHVIAETDADKYYFVTK